MIHFWSQVECKIVRFTYEVSLFDLYAYLIRESLKKENILSIFRVFAIPNKTISGMRKVRKCMKKNICGRIETNFKLCERKTFKLCEKDLRCSFAILITDVF